MDLEANDQEHGCWEFYKGEVQRRGKQTENYPDLDHNGVEYIPPMYLDTRTI
jgi:hypothetical protein